MNKRLNQLKNYEKVYIIKSVALEKYARFIIRKQT